MTITFQHLVGNFENSDKVISYNLAVNWAYVYTPRFENGTDEPDYKAQFELSGPNAILVNTISRDVSRTDDEVNGDSVHSVDERIAITIIAESRIVRIGFEDEVNRILWELDANSVNRIVKSDTTNSHIDHFEKSEVTFDEIELPGDESQTLQGSEGFLTAIYYKFRS